MAVLSTEAKASQISKTRVTDNLRCVVNFKYFLDGGNLVDSSATGSKNSFMGRLLAHWL